MMIESTILKTEYLPPISTFWAIANAKELYLEVCENYQKKSTRNRAKILGVNSVDVLSVPLQKGKNSQMPISEVTISYEDNWQGKHLHSIKSAYGNSPYFEYYFYDLEKIIQKEHESLLIFNSKVLDYFIGTLGLEIKAQETKSYQKAYRSEVLDLRSLKFNQPVIPEYIPKKYNQVFEEKHGFIPNLSILDLVMCKGPESILYL